MHAKIIGNGSDNNDGLALISLLLEHALHTAERNRGAEALGHKKTLEDDLVELGTSAASQISVHLEIESYIYDTKKLAMQLLVADATANFNHNQKINTKWFLKYPQQMKGTITLTSTLR